MKSRAACYEELRADIETIPLVDCHDHSMACGPKYSDVVTTLFQLYIDRDVRSALGNDLYALVMNTRESLEKRWPAVAKAWDLMGHTGYAQVVRRLMKKFYGEEALTLEALQRMQSKLLNLEDRAIYEGILDEAKIKVRVTDCFWQRPERCLEPGMTLAPRVKPVLNIRFLHGIESQPFMQERIAPLNRTITSLDEYIDAVREMIRRAKDEVGIVALKDPSAYSRPLQFGIPTRHEAEAAFNWFMQDPRRKLAYPDAQRPLGDYIFHEIMRMARDMDLPVQIHTGHMAGNYQDVTKGNAMLMRSVFEMHRDVRFDLLHANWPYGGEILCLCKSYPNVFINFAWTNIIDPLYSQNLFKQVLSSVPHGKIHGFGADYHGAVDRAWAHAQITRDNIAMALADMVEIDYIGMDDAQRIARMWLYDNPNRFFGLGLEPLA